MSAGDAGSAKANMRYMARVTIELTTPFAVRSGEGGFLEDTAFVVDANGLPAIPGSSLAGVLRHAADHAGMGVVEELFGPSRKSNAEPRGSRLVVSWAKAHGSDDVPIDGRRAPDDGQLSDPVVRAMREGVLRDHVRIDHRGVSADHGKFDERLVPAGARFTFELLLRGWSADADAWEALLDLLENRDLRLGGGARRGFGAFRVVARHARRFDLTDTADFDAFVACPGRLDTPARLPEWQGDARDRTGQTLTLRNLRAHGAWLSGRGAPETIGEGKDTREVDIAPLREPRIVWTENGGVIEADELLIPASAVKGALAHRVAWHFNRLRGRWADAGDPTDAGGTEAASTGTANEAVRAWFGHVPDQDGTERARAGRLILPELRIGAADGGEQRQTRHHVSLDRFTGGARNQALYQERVIPALHLCDAYTIVLTEDAGSFDADVRHALGLALRDLQRGRIAFGAGASRGYGRFVCDTIEADADLRRQLGMETAA